MALKFRTRRKGKAGKKWHADATYIRVEGCCCYLYCTVDKDGHLIDVYLSFQRLFFVPSLKKCNNTFQ
jgi:transposase-like protein